MRDITAEVMKVQGVDHVDCDLVKKIATVYPKEGAELSVKELWEAVDRTPTDKTAKIDGPTGVFTTKPDK